MMAGVSAPLSVLMISPQFKPLYGGYERAAERLSRALVDAGLRVEVVTERRDRAWPVSEECEGLRITRVWTIYRRHLHTLTSLIGFAGYLLRSGREFDVWHVHQYGYQAALAVALGGILRRPVVLKLTNSAAMGIQQALMTDAGVTARLLAHLHRKVSACVAITDETRDEARRFGIPANRIHLVPNGLPPDEFRPATAAERAAAKRQLGLDCQKLVLSVARLSEEKNPLGLLEAWSAIPPPARKGALLAMVGDGPQEGEVRRKVESLRIGDSVVLAGRRGDVENWYRAADLYVIASHNEGLSNSMIEALAGGLPVISTRVSGSSILAGPSPAGVLVEVDRAAELAGALERLLDDSALRERLSANARAVFESSFLLDTVSQQMIALYQRLAGRAPGG